MKVNMLKMGVIQSKKLLFKWNKSVYMYIQKISGEEKIF